MCLLKSLSRKPKWRVEGDYRGTHSRRFDENPRDSDFKVLVITEKVPSQLSVEQLKKEVKGLSGKSDRTATELEQLKELVRNVEQTTNEKVVGRGVTVEPNELSAPKLNESEVDWRNCAEDLRRTFVCDKGTHRTQEWKKTVFCSDENPPSYSNDWEMSDYNKV